jgi:hypothetical protein
MADPHLGLGNPLDEGKWAEGETSADYFARVRRERDEGQRASERAVEERLRQAHADRLARMFPGEDPSCHECWSLTEGHPRSKEGHLLWHERMEASVERARRSGREVYG